MDLCEVKASHVYIVSSRAVRDAPSDPVSKHAPQKY